MSLLVDMMADTRDEAYAERAAATHRQGSPQAAGPGQPRSRRLVTAVALVAVGVVTTTAITEVRGREAADTGLRGQLAAAALARTADSDALGSRAEALRSELVVLREAALGVDAAGAAAAARLSALGLASATTAVQGPGLVVTLDDAELDPTQDPADASDGRVRDTDVQDLVNALWAAGAEAVSVNDQRLTVLTAKRSAGDAVLVDLLPLKPPYVVRAIGQPAQLELGLLDGPAGRRLSSYTQLYGLRLDVQREDELRLRGAADPTLRSATPVDPAASPTGVPTGAPS